jgi:MoaA/NifB/PqqE/SkfB family radical SAM enzyme
MATLQNLFIELTTACNFHCQMCDIWQSKKQSLSFNLVKKILKEGRNLGAEQVSFSGGEPLIYPNILNTLKMAKNLGYQVFLTTNGSLIDSSNASIIAQYVDRIYIAVDGNKDIHEKLRGPNSYENALRAIKLLKNKKILTNISMVISKINYHQMKFVIDLASQEKIYQVSFQPFAKEYLFKRKNKHQYYWISGTDLKKLEKEIEDAISYAGQKKVDIMSESLLKAIPTYFTLKGKIYPRRFCQIIQKSLIVQTDGRVLPCWGWDKVLLGNIKKDSLKKIFSGQRRQNILQQKNCPGCLLACSDVDYYMPANSLSTFIKKVNRIYRLYRLKGLPYVLSKAKSEILKSFR